MFCERILNRNNIYVYVEKEYNDEPKYSLQILDEPFEYSSKPVDKIDYLRRKVIKPGFYYTTLNNINILCPYGTCLRIVEIPEDAQVVKVLNKYKKKEWMSDKIILGDRYHLYDLDTILRFNLKIDENYVYYMFKLNFINTKILDHYKSKNKRLMIRMACKILCNASLYNRIDILQWWVDNRLPLPMWKDANDSPMDLASQKSNIDILEWWKKSGTLLKYTCLSMDSASSRGDIDVLNWWLKSNLPLQYSANAINLAIKNGHINVLKWWVNSGLKLYYHNTLLDAYVKNIVEIFRFICEHKLYHRCDRTFIIHTIAEQGNIEYLKILKITEDDFYCINESILDYASKNGHAHFLDWWVKQTFPIKYSTYAMTSASTNGHVNVLEWWKNSGLELKYNYFCMDNASLNNHVDVLEWWKNSGLPLKYKNSIFRASCNGSMDALKWWYNSGLKLKGSHIDLMNASLNQSLTGWVNVVNWGKNRGYELCL
jgi:hypothetical protein